jgi:glutaminyl-tRNA synthetase
MAVLRPLRLRIENYPPGADEELLAANNPEDATAGTRSVPFGRELYIERDDFMEHPPKGFHRLAPGREVRLRYAYFVTCREVVKNAAGEVVELVCTYDPTTRGGNSLDSRRVQATLHWVAVAHAIPAEIRLYNPLFTRPAPDIGGDLVGELNPMSLESLTESRVEPALATATPGQPVQFERQGYFCLDPLSAPGRLIFNRTVALRDSWTKLRSIGAQSAEKI